MLLPLKLICPKSKARRDGTALVFIQYCYSSDNKTLLNTEICIPPKYWLKKLDRISDDLPREYGKVASLNKELQRLFRLAEDIIGFALDKKTPDPVQFAKEHFHLHFDIATLQEKAEEVVQPKNNLDVFYQIDDYIKSKSRQVVPKMLNVYRNMRDTLRAFEEYRIATNESKEDKHITFDSFDLNF